MRRTTTHQANCATQLPVDLWTTEIGERIEKGLAHIGTMPGEHKGCCLEALGMCVDLIAVDKGFWETIARGWKQLEQGTKWCGLCLMGMFDSMGILPRNGGSNIAYFPMCKVARYKFAYPALATQGYLYHHALKGAPVDFGPKGRRELASFLPVLHCRSSINVTLESNQ